MDNLCEIDHPPLVETKIDVLDIRFSGGAFFLRTGGERHVDRDVQGIRKGGETSVAARPKPHLGPPAERDILTRLKEMEVETRGLLTPVLLKGLHQDLIKPGALPRMNRQIKPLRRDINNSELHDPQLNKAACQTQQGWLKRGIVLKTLLKSKIHRAVVTRADRRYEGSISIDLDLMKAAQLVAHEHVHVWNLTNGRRFETYAIPAPPGSGQIQINGAAAHHARKGNEVIIASFAHFSAARTRSHRPRVVFVDAKNRVSRITRRSGTDL